MTSSPRRGFLRRLLTRLGLLLASTIGVLLLAEGVARVFWDAPPELEKLTGPAFGREIDPPIGYELIPGIETSWFFPGSSYCPEKVVTAKINAHGLRGREFPAARTEGVSRVFCVGDSFTFGWGVQEDETWPAALQERLDERGEKVEVWNCGIPGFNTVQEVAYLESRLLPLAPDVVVLCFYVNDTQIAEQTGDKKKAQLSPFQRWLRRQCRDNPRGLAKHVRSVSRLAQIIARRIFVKLSMIDYSANNRLQYVEEGKGWIAVTEQLRRARDLCAERGITFLVVLYPAPMREEEHLATHQPYAKVSAFCDSEGIACFDLEPVLEPLPVERMWVHPLNPHPNAELNEVAAGAIGAFLLEGAFLPGRR